MYGNLEGGLILLNIWEGCPEILLSSILEDVRADIHLPPSEGHGALVVRLQQDADRVERHLELRTQSHEDGAGRLDAALPLEDGFQHAPATVAESEALAKAIIIDVPFHLLN